MDKQWTCEEDVLCGVNEAKDAAEATDLEKKHTPVIEAPDTVKKNEPFEVTIEAGKLLAHPNEPGHFIEWMELYCGDTFLFHLGLAGTVGYPKVSVPISLTHAHGPLRARVKCNLHGLWESTREIKVQ